MGWFKANLIFRFIDSTEEVLGLSWGGLQNTTLYTSKLTTNQRTQIVDINNRHKSKTIANKLGTYCTP